MNVSIFFRAPKILREFSINLVDSFDPTVY